MFDTTGYLVAPYDYSYIDPIDGQVLQPPVFLRNINCRCTLHTQRSGEPTVNMTIWRIEYNLADQSAIANDPNSYLWDNDPVPLAAWLSSKGLNKVNFDNEIQYYRRKTPEFLQMLAAVRDNLPNG